MSQLPQNNEDFDNNPEYAKLYQADDSQQPETDGTDDWEQPASEQPPAVQGTQDGKRAANFSLLFGFLSPLSFVLGFWRKWSAGSSRRAGAEHPGYLAGVGSAEARCTCPSGSYSQLAGAMLFHRYRRPLHVYCECLVTNQLTTPSGNSKRRMQRAPFLNTRNGALCAPHVEQKL